MNNTVIYIDISGSVHNFYNYWSKVHEIVSLNKNALFFVWDTVIKQLTYNDILTYIENKKGYGGTEISCVASSIITNNFNDKNIIISEIDKSELIYGQSFIYLEIEKTQDNFIKLLNQLFNMRPHIYISNNFSEDVMIYNNISNYKINDKIFHISKSNVNHIDIYKYITSQFGGSCNAETWIRGKHYEKTDDINDLTEINKKDAIYHYTETHDHSKIALSIDPGNPWIFVGDLNRMTSQLTRGGGGFVIIDDKLWNNLNKFIF